MNSKFNILFESIMNSLITEASTKIEHNQIASIRKQIKNFGIEKKFYVQLPNGKIAGPFNKIRQVSQKSNSKTCKADAEIYNTNNKDVQPIYISLKDYAFRQFGGREDIYGGKIYKNTKDDANQKILENEFIKSMYDLILRCLEKVNGKKEYKDGTIEYDYAKLKRKIKGFRQPMIAFEIPEKEYGFFNPCKFGFDMHSENISGINNVDLVMIGEFQVNQLDKNIIELTVANEKSSVEWNTSLYGETKKNIIIDRHKMYLCFVYDERRHTFGDIKNCRFAIWPEYKVTGWIHKEDLIDFLN